MRQYDYDVIVNCIRAGAPAISDSLITGLNAVVSLANKYVEEHKAEIEAANKEASNTKPGQPDNK